MAKGRQSNGFTTDRGRVTIVGARTSNGAFSFTPVVPGEREQDWLELLDGVRSRIQPADRLEEEMSYHLALSFWQALRLHKYERAATHKQMEDAAKDAALFGDGDAMMQLLSRGVETVKAELCVMEKALGLIGAVAFVGGNEPLERKDGLLLLRLAVDLVLKGKTVEQAFSGLPEDGWTWSVVQENLTELCQAANKSMSWLLKTLSSRILEQLEPLRKTLEEDVRAIQANYALKNGETERLLLYHARVQNRVQKWLSMLAQSKADRLGLTLVEPLDVAQISTQPRKRRWRSRLNCKRRWHVPVASRGCGPEVPKSRPVLERLCSKSTTTPCRPMIPMIELIRTILHCLHSPRQCLPRCRPIGGKRCCSASPATLLAWRTHALLWLSSRPV